MSGLAVIPCYIKHICAGQCFLRHSGMWSLHHKKAGALSVESSHFDKPGDKRERKREWDRQRLRGEEERKKRGG